MSREINFPLCASCKRPITPDVKGAKFYCPQCGGFLIWRCWHCRKQVNPYKCPKCGFEGP
ncbi:MAG: RNA-binding protein [Thermoprotei archaeon]|nr:MAG: RNA-binding protein [Thermoprotei archaeon]RLF18368.1 MAG: RNA-binding protein [Thermoprotei archaeon]